MAPREQLNEPGRFPGSPYHGRIGDRRTETLREKRSFESVRKAETFYARHLRMIARHVGSIINAYTPLDATAMPEMSRALAQYAAAIAPWARTTAARMLADVKRRDEAVWASWSREMGRSLREEIQNAPTGELMRRRLEEQVSLITSLPLEAGQRVHDLTIKGLSNSTRASAYVEAIQRSGHVAASRAELIARTETARTASELTQARAVHIGSDGYIWRTARDRRVRDLHRKLQGRFVAWDDPPVAGENGEHAHAGQIYNCRCYPEPVIPEI